ncbi:MAG: epsD [Gammaproteobacteria bacterium]|jgi:glycosyltransferase involved in cell wall biosynthesis|nr:epsD [Gammaproteobacteria bacterium]
MRKNILIFGHGYATQFIDISNQYTKLFDPLKFEVTVAYLTGAPDEKIRNRHLAEHVYFLNASKRTTRGLKIAAIKKMLALQREKKFHIVICHRYKPSYIMLWVARFSKIPALFFVMHELHTLKSILRRFVIAALIQKNMFFAGVSNAVRDDIRHAIWGVPPERVITLYNMIDTALTGPLFLTRSAAREKLNLTENHFVFGTVGRLAKAKDQHTLINGFALIKIQCPAAKLVIIGDGALEENLRHHIKTLGLEQDIILTGYIDQGFGLLKAFDVFILTSVKEAFGRVLLEAMIAKVPIIATKTHGIPEVVGDAGILIDAKNPHQLGNKMLAFYHASEAELTKWRDKGFQRATEYFSISRFNALFWQLPFLKELL